MGYCAIVETEAHQYPVMGKEGFMLADLLLVFAVALLLTMVFMVGFRGQRNKIMLLMYFLVLFFATWAGALWLNPVQFPGWGQRWMPFLVIGLVFALFLAAFAPPSRPALTTQESKEPVRPSGITFNLIFWLLLLVLGVAIAVSYV